ncbi:MAG: hypothetical protein KatS3mg044_0357 [Rhodothermaceae bacterium]|nr:MAG: hypothetical protein KatS3mg044_0357 [Rhodothermaceae bacterium]
MKKTIGSLFTLLIGLVLVTTAQARQNDVVQAWEMTPKIGHNGAFQAALAAHAKWRQEHDDPWSWNLWEITTGPRVGTIVARSGGHTWADFDTYQTWEHAAAASRHFESTVAPHLASVRSVITIGDEENVYWPEDQAEARVAQVIGFDLHRGMMGDFVKAVNTYSKTIVEHNFDAHHYLAYNASGGEHDAILVLPGSSMADFSRPDKTVEQLMIEVHGKEAFQKLEKAFNATIKDSDSFFAVHRVDLSVVGATVMAGN